MAWTSPMTAVSNTPLTASQWNAQVRDNFLETAPALASASGQYFVADGTNSIAARQIASGVVATAETTSASSYTDLATVGPSATATTGDTALVLLRAEISVPSATAAVRMSYAVSGATTVAASNNWSVGYAGSNSSSGDGQTLFACGYMFETGLNPGSNVFTAKYQTSSGTAKFSIRRITVIPF